MPYISYQAIYNDVELTSVTGLTVLAIDTYKPAQRGLKDFMLDRSNASTVTSGFYAEKPITVRLGISRTTRALAEQSLDQVMKIIQPLNKWLTIKQSGLDRKYLCSFDSHNMLVSGGSYIEMELVFKCHDRFGYEPNPTLALTYTQTTNRDYGKAISFDGSAPTQAPIVSLTFNSVTMLGGTAVIAIGNPATGQLLSITNSFAAGDLYLIDAENRTVTKNGTAVEFAGIFPEWEPGAGGISYQDLFINARNITFTVTYHKRYV